jgi:hypothetical protein
MAERRVALLALCGAVLIPQAVRAQISSSLQAGALSTAASNELPATQMFRVAPDLRLESRHLTLSASSSAWLDQRNWLLADANARAKFTSPVAKRLRGEVEGGISRAFDARSVGSDQLDLQARVQFLFKEHAGLWLGGGAARPWRLAVVSSVDVMNGGAWVTRGSGTLSTTMTRYDITKESIRRTTDGVTTCGWQVLDLRVRETLFAAGGCRQRSRVSDFDVAGNWQLLGVEYAGKIGHRFGAVSEVTDGSRNWASFTVTRWVAPRAAIVIGGGSEPSDPLRGLKSRSYGSLGMVFAYAARPRAVPIKTPDARMLKAKLSVASVAPDTQRVTIRVGSVEKVEIMGDFSEWEPRALVRRSGTDIWELQLPMAAGLYRINVRLDGGRWGVPPGLLARKDGFGGESGILIVTK